MASVGKILNQMKTNPASVKYADLHKVCTHYFGDPRKGSGSHQAIFKMPWAGDPRVNLQNDKGMAKAYQVKQVLKAIEKLEGEQ